MRSSTKNTRWYTSRSDAVVRRAAASCARLSPAMRQLRPCQDCQKWSSLPAPGILQVGVQKAGQSGAGAGQLPECGLALLQEALERVAGQVEERCVV